MAEVEFKHIEKSFSDGTQAVRDFSLAVNDGEFMVLVGPSGCGKSTLLRMMAGLETATSGEILIGGAVVNKWTPQQRNVAMVFQNYALYPHMTVRRNLEFPLRMAKLRKDEIHRRVAETAHLLSLTELLDRKPRQLSGGQRQRVAMGRAVVRKPSVFLMDEPLSNLDAKLRVQIRTEIASLQERLGTTTIYVTHDQVEAMTLGTRVAVIDAGKLQQVDPPQELYTHPANIFVASFLGNPGMNLLPVLIKRNGFGQLSLKVGNQSLKLDQHRLTAHNYTIDQPLLAGIRPEDLFPVTRNPTQTHLELAVKTVESLGHEHLVYGHVSGLTAMMPERATQLLRAIGHNSHQLVARFPSGFQLTADTKLTVGVHSERIYFFTLEGQALN
jgi:multiple sugar transport system ATP-binding protein